MTGVRFGQIFVMPKAYTEHMKTIKKLGERDRYMGSLAPDVTDLAAGKYDLYSLPETSRYPLLVVTEADREAIRRYQDQHPVGLPKDEHSEVYVDDLYYEKIMQRNQDFLTEQSQKGAHVALLPGLPRQILDRGLQVKEVVEGWVKDMAQRLADLQNQLGSHSS